MIDIENYVFTRLCNAIHEKYPEANVLGDYVEELATFPAVTIREYGNETLKRMQDDEPVEHYATVVYEVNVYCNERLGKRAQCKDILGIVDREMMAMKFTKRPQRQLPAVNNTRTIHRMYARYTAVVDEGTLSEDGKTITHYMYRG